MVCELEAIAIPPSPSIVIRLKGSVMLTTASRAFSSTVIGFTSGPVVKRAYQLMKPAWSTQTVVPTACSPAADGAAWIPAEAMARTAAVFATVAPVFWKSQESKGLGALAGLACGAGALAGVGTGCAAPVWAIGAFAV